MKRARLRIALIFGFMFSIAGPLLQAQEKHCAVPEVERRLRQIAEEFKDGYNAGDPERVAALYTEDATYLTQHFASGIVQGRAAIKAYVKNGTDAKYKIDSIQMLASDCSGDFGYAITRYESTNAGQKAFGVNLVVVKKIDGKWLIVAHESAVPDPATAIQKLDIPAK
ncbi:MAG: YybH family protein [Acidobacteriaceae bacterium]